MGEYNVRIYPAGQNDLLEAIERIKLLPADEAARQLNNIEEKLAILKTAPETCLSARDSQLRVRGYKMLAIDDYIYFFMIKGRTVEVRRIIYASALHAK
ncbi:MAG: hypothetical protein FWD05_11795 [Oscillospiraceae bacterium]|nr:hypothetical protein [Oscillospiraceae bacterium]